MQESGLSLFVIIKGIWGQYWFGLVCGAEKHGGLRKTGLWPGTVSAPWPVGVSGPAEVLFQL